MECWQRLWWIAATLASAIASTGLAAAPPPPSSPDAGAPVAALAAATRAYETATDAASKIALGSRLAAAAVSAGEVAAAAGDTVEAGERFALAARVRGEVYPLELAELEAEVREAERAWAAARTAGGRSSPGPPAAAPRDERVLRSVLDFALERLVDRAQEAGDLDTAASAARRRVEVAEQAAEPLALAAALEDAAVVVQGAGDEAGARAQVERALALRRATGGGATGWRSLWRLGSLADAAGEVAAAEARARELLAELAAAPVAPSTGAAAELADRLTRRLARLWALRELSQLALSRGDFRAAREEQDRIDALVDEQRADSAPGDQTSALVLATLQQAADGELARQLEARGELALAADAYRRSLQTATALAGSGIPFAGAHVALARVERDMGHLDEAEASLRLALAEEERRHDVAGMARALGQESALRLDQHRAVEARDLAASALLLAREHTDRLTVAGLLRAQSRAEGELGAAGLAAAEGHLREAIATFDEEGLRLPAAYARAQLGEVLERLGHDDEAIAASTAAVDAIEAMAGTLRGDRERDLFHRDAADRRLYARLVALLVRHGREREALAYVERSHAKAVVDALAGLGHDGAARSPALARAAAAREALQAATQALEGALATPAPVARRVAALRARVAAATRESAAAEAGLRRADAALASLMAVDRAAPEASSRRLGRDELLLEYLVTDHETLVFARRRGEAPVVRHSAIEAAALRAEVEAFHDALTRGDDAALFTRAKERGLAAFWRPDGSPEFAEQLAPLRQASVALRRTLLAPVEDLLRGVDRLLVVPDGPLQTVPFAALAAERADGSLRFAGEDLAISYLAGPEAVVAAPPPPGTPSLLAVGDPDGSLPAAADEAREVAAEVPGSRALIGAEASLAALRAARGPTYLHLATHGVLDGADPKESYLVLAGDPARLTVRDLVERRAGLSLAGTALVTLSACETHLGNGDPMALYGSLSRAFAAAGVPAVVASLWPVDDEATRLTMVTFYRGIAAGESPSSALRAAQLAVAADPRFAQPVYWAPFVLLEAGTSARM